MLLRRPKTRGKRFVLAISRRTAAALLALSLVFYGLFAVERQIRPVLLSLVEYESKRYAISAFNDAVMTHIAREPDAYQGLYRYTYGADGTIVAVQADAYALNLLASDLTEEVEARMNAMEDSHLTVAAGTLLGIQAFAGRGPKMELHVLPETYVEATVYDTLESAGINQTKLCVYVHFTMQMSVILSGYTANVTAEDDICLAQVLLVGQVPQTYWGQSEN